MGKSEIRGILKADGWSDFAIDDMLRNLMRKVELSSITKELVLSFSKREKELASAEGVI